MSYLAYKVLHLVGVFFVFAALGGMLLRRVAGTVAGSADGRDRAGKLAGLTHGLALVVVLVSGFGLLARLGIGFPGWVWAKLVIWLLLGGCLVAIRRLPRASVWLWWLLPLLGALAAYLALYKPAF